MAAAESSELRRCPHCGNMGRMAIIASGTNTLGEEVEDSEGHKFWDYQGENQYRVLICQACEKPLLDERWAFQDQRFHDWSLLHPESPQILPKSASAKVVEALIEAERVRSISANAYGTLAARALERICRHKKCKPDTLHRMIDELAKAEEIPPRLAEMAQQLRSIRNHGAHGGDVDLTPAEVPVMRAILAAIVEYIYFAPQLLEDAQKLVTKLNGKKKNP